MLSVPGVGEAPGARGTLPVRRGVGGSRFPEDAPGVGAAAGAQGTGMLRVPEPVQSPARRRSGAGRAGAQPGRAGAAPGAAPRRRQSGSGIAAPVGPARTQRAAAGAAGCGPLFPALPALPSISRAPFPKRPREAKESLCPPPGRPPPIVAPDSCPAFQLFVIPASLLCAASSAPRGLGAGAGAVFGGQQELTRSGEFAGGIPGLLWEVPAPSVLWLCARTRGRAGDTGLWWERSQSRSLDVCLDVDLGRKAGSGVSSAAIHHRRLSLSLWNSAGLGSPAVPRECCRRSDGARLAPRSSVAPPRHRSTTSSSRHSPAAGWCLRIPQSVSLAKHTFSWNSFFFFFFFPISQEKLCNFPSLSERSHCRCCVSFCFFNSRSRVR